MANDQNLLVVTAIRMPFAQAHLSRPRHGDQTTISFPMAFLDSFWDVISRYV